MPPTLQRPVVARLTRAAIFLVATISPGTEHNAAVRSLCGDLAGLVRAVSFRDLEGELSCILGFGSDAWRGCSTRQSRKTCIRSAKSMAGATRWQLLVTFSCIFARPGWICASSWRPRSCRGSVARLMLSMKSSGFSYFDNRDLIGFVDGTENPVGQPAISATIIGEEDAAFAGGSYVIVQKYLHDLDRWNTLPIEEQEKIIGRKKLSDIELDDTVKPTSAHNALTT